MPNSVHDGHRRRMRQEVKNKGIDKNTPSHKILEFLLFYCISRKDTNLIAHDLIRRFGSLSGVLDASVEELIKVDGIGEHTALLLKSIMPIARIYMEEKANNKTNFNDLDEIGNYALKQYAGITVERVAVVSLDAKGKLLGFDFFGEGDISSVGISFRKVIGILIERNATVTVLVHNHPSGIAVPSGKDISVTESLADMLKNVGIILADHIIIGAGDFVSMAQSKEYSHIFMH